MTNKYFRYRLYAQGFTITAMIGGAIYYNADRFKRAQYQKMMKKQKEQEKKDKWIRELEAREIEDKEWRARLSKARSAEKEAEEIRLVQEKKIQEAAALARTEEAGSDHKPVTDAIRLQNAETKTKGNRQPIGVVQPPLTAAPVSSPASSKEEAEEEEFRPILGESKFGGLFGIGYLKAVWEMATKPKDKQEEEGEEPVAGVVSAKQHERKEGNDKQLQVEQEDAPKQQLSDQKDDQKSKIQDAATKSPK